MTEDLDPFPGCETIGLENSPSGPYAILVRPWSAERIPATIDEVGLLLGASWPWASPSPAGVRLTACVRRITGRWPTLMTFGAVHVRGFDASGRMLWRGVFDRMAPVDMVGAYGQTLMASFDLMFPTTMEEMP